jgi:hypothetical protein
MDATNGVKSYCLSPEQVETLLQADFADRLKPVNYEKLRQLQRQQQRQAAMANMFKNKYAEVINDAPSHID